ncbi:hypothetical protein Scep_002185 [Stephania cephalantha]|uniref:Uncharacterized protein n=1 Tax=Stephania cephalantha TaxID=152367 RepID=A0AAP0LDG9_9MAGN
MSRPPLRPGSLALLCQGDRRVRNLYRLLELEPQSTVPYVAMANIYASDGRWNDLAKFRTMRKVRRSPEEDGGVSRARKPYRRFQTRRVGISTSATTIRQKRFRILNLLFDFSIKTPKMAGKFPLKGAAWLLAHHMAPMGLENTLLPVSFDITAVVRRFPSSLYLPNLGRPSFGAAFRGNLPLPRLVLGSALKPSQKVDDESRWTPLGSRRRHAGTGSSRTISAHDEPIELLRKNIKEMQTNLLLVIQDNTFDHDELPELQGRLGRMEQTLIDILGISFAPPMDDLVDSEIDDDFDDKILSDVYTDEQGDSLPSLILAYVAAKPATCHNGDDD